MTASYEIPIYGLYGLKMFVILKFERLIGIYLRPGLIEFPCMEITTIQLLDIPLTHFTFEHISFTCRLHG